jgi:glycosyltransferase involved in cell wall biosynthesis
MSSARVALVALTTSGAAGEYVAGLADAVARHTAACVWVPDRPSIETSTAEQRAFAKPGTRGAVAWREASSWLHPSAIGVEVMAWAPDVVHVVFGEGYPTAARLCRDLVSQGTTTVATWHDPQPHGQPLDRVQHAVAARTMRVVSGVHIHCSELVPAGFKGKVLIAEHPAFACPLCPDHTTTLPLRTDGSIITVGRFAPYKGMDELCAALDSYWRTGGSRVFEVVGQGKLPSSLRRLHTSWPSSVRITNDYVSNTALHEALTKAAVCVMPYLSATQSALPWLARMHGAHLIATDVGCVGSVGRRLGARVISAGAVNELADALHEPPALWSDVGRMPLPTFDSLAEQLLEWYPTVSAA